jgi:hypothetical protein
MRATLGRLRSMSAELLGSGTYTSMSEAVPYGELRDRLTDATDRRDH